MVYVRPLSDAERRDVRRRARTDGGRVSERIRMVRLSDRRSDVPQIAVLCACSEATVRGWLARDDAFGSAGLYDRPRPGRPRQAGAAAREVIRHDRDATPGRRATRAASGAW